MSGNNRQKVQDRKRKKSRTFRGEEQLAQDRKRKDTEIKPLTAKNFRQKEALKAFNQYQLVILSGSAGVGKTELICWYACMRWLKGEIDNIVITRPYKHLGSDYGAVKGGDSEKLLTFCMSILNKLKKYLGVGILKNNFHLEGFDFLFSEASGISIVPIEKIQGMSFNDRTIIIADELQNAEVSQIKSLTTRAEEGCQILCAGDPRQTALKRTNGLSFIEDVLEKYPTEYAKVIHFEKSDVVRGGLSSHLVQAFEEMGNWQ